MSGGDRVEYHVLSDNGDITCVKLIIDLFFTVFFDEIS